MFANHIFYLFQNDGNPLFLSAYCIHNGAWHRLRFFKKYLNGPHWPLSLTFLIFSKSPAQSCFRPFDGVGYNTTSMIFCLLGSHGSLPVLARICAAYHRGRRATYQVCFSFYTLWSRPPFIDATYVCWYWSEHWLMPMLHCLRPPLRREFYRF